MSVSKQTTKLLREWGRWSRQSVGSPRVKTNVETVQAALEPTMAGGPSPAEIMDDDALTVDTGVAAMCNRHAEMGNVLSFYYRSSEPSVRGIARSLDMPKSRVTSLLNSAEAWMDCYLSERITYKY
ncbi:antiterminator Q family protein [Kushneria phosphatilytica]|uniref:antiterminator Q family protein n=1 Tax=Kushneria phosphatilytica TaxID=657387 RepID=UPI0008D9051C|nr:hypothetical protein BH688_05640 [Kushneria phosphatilytica]